MAYTYIVSCKDNTLYTGAAVDLTARIETHNQGKGAKYTRGRLPVKLVFAIELPDYSLACKYESWIKKLTRKQKFLLINAYANQKSNYELIELVNSLKKSLTDEKKTNK